MEVRLLGSVEARAEGARLTLGGPKQRAVLAMLALEPNTPLAADRLIDGLWGDDPPPSAPKMVQLYVSQLRKVLAGSGAEIVTRGRGYELSVAPDAVDAVRFERLVEQAVRADGAGGSTAREALALWRGAPLHDVAGEPFAAEAIRRLEDLWLQARELAVETALAEGRHEAVVGELDELVARHPLRERLHALRMLALYRSGRQAEALEAYRHARGVLVEEVGVEPGPELRALHEQVLRQDPALDAPARARTRPPAPGPRGRRSRLLAAGVALVALAGVAAFAVARLGDDDLGGIDGGAVGVIDADGDVVEQYRVGSAPGAVAAGGGSVWVANPRDGTVSRIDRGRAEVVTIDVGEEPTALAFGAGSLWVTDGRARSVVQVDPRTNRVVRRVPAGNAPRGVTVGHGAVWVSSSVEGRVDRVALGDGASSSAPVPGGPAQLAATADAVWVLAEDAGAVTRLDPRSGAALRTVGVGNGPTAVVAGEGAVWVANRDDGTVSKIDPSTDAVAATIPVGGHPAGLAVGAGRLWVADAGGEVLRVDPADGEVERRVAVGSAPGGLAVEGDAVWAVTEPAAAAHRGGTLRVQSARFDACECIDPIGYDGATWPLLSLAYDGLLAYRRTGGTAGNRLVANLVTAVPTPQDGGRTYVLQLRPGLRFSDGSALRASDFRASIERVLRVSGGILPPLSSLEGADGCTRQRCDLTRGIEVDDAARTITLRLARPDAELLHALTVPLTYVVPRGTPARLLRSDAAPGSGPYRIERFDRSRGVTLVRNEHFRSWSPVARPDGFADRIEFVFGDGGRRQLDAVLRGDSDVVSVAAADGVDLPHDELRALSLRAGGRVHPGEIPSIDYLFLNVREAPFDDVRVRRALNHAIDRRRVARLLGGAPAVAVTCQILAPGLQGYEPRCPYTRSPTPAGAWSAPNFARARRLVERSGTRGAAVTVRGFVPLVPAAREAVATLRRLGFRARLRVMGQEDYFPLVYSPDSRVQIGPTAWFADFLAPSSFAGPIFSCSAARSGGNPSRYCSPRFEKAVERAAATSGPEATRLWSEVDRVLTREAPAVPLVTHRRALVVSDRVGNVQQHLQLGPLLDQMWVR